ncbi:MAG TPA: 3'-5' exonuclease [Candidatus Paceibacterota bacterium]|nr:3'-5' exonuclease [Candidatus Paceibacterota bacterium]
MIVVDVETTGVDPVRHAIVAIGAIDFASPQHRFYRECRIWDGAQVQAEALAVNGFTHEQITDPARPSAEQAIAEFVAFCRESPERTLAGQNTSFDRDFLQAAADRHNLAWQFGHRVLDLHSFCWLHMAKAGIPQPQKNVRSSLSLNAILKYCGLPEEPRPHNGLTGAVMEAEAFHRLIHGASLIEEFKKHPLPEGFGVPPVPPQHQLL